MSELKYTELGLRIGLEVHIQLDTSRKLFCHCPTTTSHISRKSIFQRYLRPARSEIGEVDPAALLEWKKNRVYRYDAPEDTSCLVEVDEEPPHHLDEESLLVALAVARVLNMDIVDEVHVMRKIVIDGSNVTGFQRTSLIAMNGYIDVEGRRIGIQTMCLEEDAARKIDERDLEVYYSLDRLGIPLIEIATAPDIDSPELAFKTALKIGQLVRLTMKAKRGLGSIRQDLNISIRQGAKVEVKGIQHLYLIPKIIENEVLRQLKLIEIRNELVKRNIDPGEIKYSPVDVTRVFENTSSKLIKKALSIPGTTVLAVKLPGFKGLLKTEIQRGRRFGTELSDYAKVWGGVGGVIHTDELPSYGITTEEVSKLYVETGGDPERDVVVFTVDERSRCEKALRAVVDRAREAVIGIPEETRAANPDGTTRYMRPRPGAARMYPETDIPPISITEELVEKARRYIPEHPDMKLRKLIESHGLSKSLAYALLDDLRLDYYEYLAEKYGKVVSYSIIASLFVNVIPSLRREGVPVDDLDENILEDVVRAVAENSIAKEAIPEVLAYVARNPGVDIRRAIEALGLTRIGIDELDLVIIKVIEDNKEKILAKRDKAFTIVMGEVMKTMRGRIDGKIVAERVKMKIREMLNIEL